MELRVKLKIDWSLPFHYTYKWRILKIWKIWRICFIFLSRWIGNSIQKEKLCAHVRLDNGMKVKMKIKLFFSREYLNGIFYVYASKHIMLRMLPLTSSTDFPHEYYYFKKIFRGIKKAA